MHKHEVATDLLIQLMRSLHPCKQRPFCIYYVLLFEYAAHRFVENTSKHKQSTEEQQLIDKQ